MKFLMAILLAAAPPSRAEQLKSPDGRFSWEKGAPHVTLHKTLTGKTRRDIRLPAPGKSGGRRKVLFSNAGPYFCILDEQLSEIGLHLKARRGAKGAKALLFRATLQLLDENGRVHWKKTLRDTHALRDPEGLRPQIASDGTLAILLQDADAVHVNPRPLLHVFDPKGTQRLKLNYLSWRRIDRYRLSEKGDKLFVLGYGLIEEQEDWGRALGVYSTRTQTRRIGALADGDPDVLLRNALRSTGDE